MCRRAPAAAALAKPPTHEGPDGEHPEPLASLPAPSSEEVLKVDIDALIAGTLPPESELPEQAARGTWGESASDLPAPPPSFSPARLPDAALTWRPAQESRVPRLLGVLGAIVLLSGLGFAYLRYGAAIRARLGGSIAATSAGQSRDTAPAVPAESAKATAAPVPLPSASASASAPPPPPERVAKPPAAASSRPPRSAPAPGASVTKTLERAFGASRD